MTEKDLNKVMEFITRTQDLPIEIIEDEDFKYYSIDNPEEKKLEEIRYDTKRNRIYSILDDLLLEIRAFIKIKFGKESEYWEGFNGIGFNSVRVEGFIMNTFNINHNKYWSNGRRQLISLLKNIEAEIKVHIEMNFEDSISEVTIQENETIKDYLLRCVANGQTEQVFKTLFIELNKADDKDSLNEAIIFNAQFSQLKSQQSFKTISHENAAIENARITKGIIELIQREF